MNSARKENAFRAFLKQQSENDLWDHMRQPEDVTCYRSGMAALFFPLAVQRMVEAEIIEPEHVADFCIEASLEAMTIIHGSQGDRDKQELIKRFNEFTERLSY